MTTGRRVEFGEQFPPQQFRQVIAVQNTDVVDKEDGLQLGAARIATVR